jgi:hypothetical protein
MKKLYTILLVSILLFSCFLVVNVPTVKAQGWHDVETWFTNLIAGTRTETKTDAKTNTESTLISQTTAAVTDTVYGSNWFAQTFSYSAKFNLTRVSLKLRKTGSPIVNFKVSIRRTLNGNDLVSAVMNASYISTTATWYSFTMNYILNASTSYGIVCRLEGGDSSNYVNLYLYQYNYYSGGKRYKSTDSGSTWTSLASEDWDYGFYVYGFTVAKTLTFSNTIVSVNYVKVNNTPWTDYTYSGNTLTVNGLNNLGTYNIEASAEVLITWHNIETWFIKLLTMMWRNVETWFVKLVSRIWNNVESWNIQVVGMMWNYVENWFVKFLTMSWRDVEVYFVKLWTMACRNVEEWSVQFIVLVCHTVEEWFVKFWTLEAIYIPTAPTINYGLIALAVACVAIAFSILFSGEEKKK